MQNWTRQELLAAFNLYCRTPFSKIGYRKPEIITLAKVLNRTPSAVALKLVNFSRLDPALQKRHVVGMRHGSKGEEAIWKEYFSNPSKLLEESEKIVSEKIEATVEAIEFKKGEDIETVSTRRSYQNFFREAVLASYNYCCCITNIPIPALLVASHIIPWSMDESNRLNPSNGLCLNYLYDAAFDKGLITIDQDLKVVFSKRLKKCTIKNENYSTFFKGYENITITLPKRFLPDKAFLNFHNNKVFLDSL